MQAVLSCGSTPLVLATAVLQVFEGVISKPGQTRASNAQLTPAEKKKRVVLKRVNLDKAGIRSNFLATGTQARVSPARSSSLSARGWARLTSTEGPASSISCTFPLCCQEQEMSRQCVLLHAV